MATMRCWGFIFATDAIVEIVAARQRKRGELLDDLSFAVSNRHGLERGLRRAYAFAAIAIILYAGLLRKQFKKPSWWPLCPQFVEHLYVCGGWAALRHRDECVSESTDVFDRLV